MEGMRALIGLKKRTCEVTLARGGIKIISWKTKKKEEEGKSRKNGV